MIKIAFTVWGDRISPVFDCADTLLIVEITNKQVKNRHLESFNSAKPLFLIEKLIEQEVSLLICGAISEMPADLIENSSLKLIPFISGNVDKIIDRFRTGLSLGKTCLMPGCGWNQRGCTGKGHPVLSNKKGNPKNKGNPNRKGIKKQRL